MKDEPSNRVATPLPNDDTIAKSKRRAVAAKRANGMIERPRAITEQTSARRDTARLRASIAATAPAISDATISHALASGAPTLSRRKKYVGPGITIQTARKSTTAAITAAN
jgi:hypothetical protein